MFGQPKPSVSLPPLESSSTDPVSRENEPTGFEDRVFSTLITTYSRFLRACFARWGVPGFEREDLIQSVWIRLLTHWRREPSTYHPEHSTFRRYLQIVARHLLFDYYRRLRRSLSLSAGPLPLSGEGHPFSDPDAVIDAAILAEERERLIRLRDQLDFQNQQLFDWCLAGESTRQIADRLACARSSAHREIVRLFGVLRRHLESST